MNTNIHEYCEEYPVEFIHDSLIGKDIICAINEGGFNSVSIDAKETYEFLKKIYCPHERATNIKDFAKYLIKEIESLPKTPNGYSKTYDEAMMIGVIENCLEDYLAK